MALTVLVRSGDSDSAPEVTFDAPRVVLGRGAGCDLRLPDPSVSHRHASIRQRGSDFIVVDEGSTNGTFVGPVRLSAQSPRVIKTGELIRLGRIWVEIRLGPEMVTQNVALATREIALRLVADALAAQGEPTAVRVRVIAGPSEGAELEIEEVGAVYVVGRNKTCALTLQHDDVSRRHVELSRSGKGVLVRDLGSKNGVLLDGARLESTAEAVWRAGTELGIGPFTLSLEDGVAATLDELEAMVDERLGNEAVEPPAGREGVHAPPSPAPESPRTPRAEPPRRSPRRAPARGWTGSDVVVALLAVGVIAISLLGLWWVLASD